MSEHLSGRFGRRLVFAIVALALVPVPASAQKLQKTLERKFPTEWCPLDTPFMGTFQSETGIVRLTFTTNNGSDTGFFSFFEQKLDDVMIVLASEFAANSADHPFCYLDNIVPVYTGDVQQGAPTVPLFDTFTPSGSPCPWDELHGATINAADGWIELGSFGLGEATITTSVLVSGLTPNVDYVIHGNWFATSFLDDPLCVPGSVCMEVRVDDVADGCQPLSTRESTWGAVKALYR
jgi:hypothetical protein